MKVTNKDVTDGSFSTKNKRILESHQKNHKIIKCQHCIKYLFQVKQLTRDKKHCNATSEKLSCGVCEYETVDSANMRTHRKNRILRPFLCRVGDCRRMLKSADDLLNHVKF